MWVSQHWENPITFKSNACSVKQFLCTTRSTRRWEDGNTEPTKDQGSRIKALVSGDRQQSSAFEVRNSVVNENSFAVVSGRHGLAARKHGAILLDGSLFISRALSAVAQRSPIAFLV